MERSHAISFLFNGDRHELGRNFLTHRPTIQHLADLVAASGGSILEIGAGDGVIAPLARLGRDLTAIEIDEHRVRSARRRLSEVRVEHTDVLGHPLDRVAIGGNLPFHLTGIRCY